MLEDSGKHHPIRKAYFEATRGCGLYVPVDEKRKVILIIILKEI